MSVGKNPAATAQPFRVWSLLFLLLGQSKAQRRLRQGRSEDPSVLRVPELGKGEVERMSQTLGTEAAERPEERCEGSQEATLAL